MPHEHDASGRRLEPGVSGDNGVLVWEQAMLDQAYELRQRGRSRHAEALERLMGTLGQQVTQGQDCPRDVATAAAPFAELEGVLRLLGALRNTGGDLGDGVELGQPSLRVLAAACGAGNPRRNQQYRALVGPFDEHVAPSVSELERGTFPAQSRLAAGDVHALAVPAAG